jgi:sugar (pentulose or hexulose) kinase
MTDANASQVASGAVDKGSWVTTIGTGLSIKGTSDQKIQNEINQVYSHRHWDRGWIPSATSHCGADAIGVRFNGQNMAQLSHAAAQLPMSSVLVLPLATVGEFFPFHAPSARGFELGSSAGPGDLFRGYLEGVAFIERLALERLEDLGADVRGPQVTMGGGALNTLWMNLRASVLGRPVLRAEETSAAFGASLIALAANPKEISRTARRLVRYNYEAEPHPIESGLYHSRYEQFLDELKLQGYLPESPS